MSGILNLIKIGSSIMLPPGIKMPVLFLPNEIKLSASGSLKPQFVSVELTSYEKLSSSPVFLIENPNGKLRVQKLKA